MPKTMNNAQLRVRIQRTISWPKLLKTWLQTSATARWKTNSHKLRAPQQGLQGKQISLIVKLKEWCKQLLVLSSVREFCKQSGLQDVLTFMHPKNECRLFANCCP